MANNSGRTFVLLFYWTIVFTRLGGGNCENDGTAHLPIVINDGGEAKSAAADEGNTDLPLSSDGGLQNYTNSSAVLINEQDERKQHNHAESAHEHDIHVASWNYDYVQKPLLITLFIIVISVIKIVFHHAHGVSAVVPESCLLIIIGILIGFLFLIDHAEVQLRFIQYNAKTFFLYLLPPIILEAAYSLRDRAFAENLGTIMLYAVVGTILNIFIVGPLLYGVYAIGWMGSSLHMMFLECLIFSAVVAAVDPVAVLAIFQELGVNKMLYFMVFGESLFNDAVTVVIYNMVVSFIQIDNIGIRELGLGLTAFVCASLGAMTIGFLCGFLTAFITKYTHQVRVVEPIILFGVAYLSYLGAELFHFSGIISIICCGIIQSHYAVENISSKSYISVHYFSKVASGVTESLIFIILGVMLVTDHGSWLNANAVFIIAGLLLCIVSRFVVVFMLAYWVNWHLVGIRKINLQEQFIMAYGGLRGAITFSLVFMLDANLLSGKEEKKDLLLTATYIIIFFTTFLQGITIKPLVKIMRIKLQAHDTSVFREIHRAAIENTMAGVEEVIGHKGTYYWAAMSKHVSQRFLRPWLQRYPQKKGTRLVACYQEMELQKQVSEVSIPKPDTIMTELDTFDSLDMPNSVSDARLDRQDERTNSLQKEQAAAERRRSSSRKPSQLTLESPSDLLALRDMLQLTPNKTLHYVYDPNLTNEDKRHKSLMDSIRNMSAIRKRSNRRHKREEVRKHLLGSVLVPIGMGMGLTQGKAEDIVAEAIDEDETTAGGSSSHANMENKNNGKEKEEQLRVTFKVDDDPVKKGNDGSDDELMPREDDPLC